jgi:RNA 2',3'-cyclic 3'-phosphodiesterase
MNAIEKKSLRLFYALWPDAGTRARLAQLQARVHGQTVRHDNLHLTLAFLGEQSAALLPTLHMILELLPRRDIVLTLDRVGYFTRKRIAWAGTHELPESLGELERSLVQELMRHDIAFDRRTEFKPHVTLARDADAPPDLPFEPIVWRADKIALVQSVMQPGGVHYEVLALQRPHGPEPDFGN